MTHDSTKTQKLSLVAVLLFGIVLITAFIPSKWVGMKPPINTHTPVDFTQLDTANDFLKDSDKDGTVTWKELIESASDEASTPFVIETTQPSKEAAQALNDPNNLTASFAKNLAIASLYIKNNNITDQESQKKIMEGLTQEEIAKTVSKKYLYSDIRVSEKEDKVTLHTYGNQVAKIVNGLITNTTIEEDLPGVMMYLEKKDVTSLEKITKDAKRVHDMVNKLLAVEVPPSAVVYHLMTLNQIVIYGDMLSNLSKADEDPVRAAISVQKYPDELVRTLRIYKNLSDYFTTKNIVFTPKEQGYVFTIGYTLE